MDLFVVCENGKPVSQVGNLMFAYSDKKGANKKAAQLQKHHDNWLERLKIYHSELYAKEIEKPKRVYTVEKYIIPKSDSFLCPK